MAEDLQGNLETYQLQLQQVEAALTAEPTNDEYLKLKQDLLEVINLTEELIKAQQGHDGSSPSSSNLKSGKDWKVGDKCMAPWSNNGQYYDCTIEEITSGGEVSVRFDAFGNSDVTTLTMLRHRPRGLDFGTADKSLAEKLKNKREQMKKQREYLKNRKVKKQQRVKELEEAREVEKNKWQSFNAKAMKSKKGGIVKKSIFATPEGPEGKVGVGTCGISGKPMTSYSHAEKYKKK